LWIWRHPSAFTAWCAQSKLAWIGEPVDVLRALFGGFKILQCGVFVAWCFIHGNGSLLPLGGDSLSLAGGAALVLAGQILNVGVFYRLGKHGVFYGNKLGYQIPLSKKFPFSWFKHPQYVGTLLSIWGFFLIMRFPQSDWYMLPALETIYYALGAHLER